MPQVLVWLLLSTAPAGPCYVASDATPGWKQVALPDDARSLAAPAGIDQFRSDESVAIVDERSGLYLEGRSDGPGVTAFDFTIEGGAP